MPRSFFFPGLFFITAALILLLLVSISLPFLTSLDFVRVHFNTGLNSNEADSINQIRVRRSLLLRENKWLTFIIFSLVYGTTFRQYAFAGD